MSKLKINVKEGREKETEPGDIFHNGNQTIMITSDGARYYIVDLSDGIIVKSTTRHQDIENEIHDQGYHKVDAGLSFKYYKE